MIKWFVDGGEKKIQVLTALNEEISEDDMQPRLDWEADVWVLANRVSSGFGVDMGSFLSIATKKKWNIDIALELLEFRRTEEAKSNARK